MKKIVLYALLGLSLTTTSCSDDFLDVDYYDLVSPEGVYSTKENVFKGLIGVYNYLWAEDNFYVKPQVMLANYATLDMQGGGWDAEMCNHSWGVEQQSRLFQRAWTYSYKQVSRCNLFLRDLKEVDESVLSAAEKKIYEAEVRGIRAAAYYYLTINFSRVPMLMEGETYANVPYKPRPENDDEAWRLIKEDFEFAASVLDWKPAEGMIGRFTKGAALAYAAKANMYMGDYASAKTLYKQVIDSGVYKLNPCYRMTNWVDNPASEEGVWEVSFAQFDDMSFWLSITGGVPPHSYKHFGTQFKPIEYSGWGDSYTSYEHVRCYEPGDKRLMYNVIGWDGHSTENIDENTGKPKGDENPFIAGKIIGNTETYQHFFMPSSEFMPNNHSIKWWITDTQYTAFSVPLYRYTAVLLDYAECCFRTGDEASGWKIINDIRNRAWGNLEVGHDPNECGSALPFPNELLNTATVTVPDGKTYYTAYKNDKGYTVDAWMVALFQERRKEFYQEFSLWYDLTRCKMVEEWLKCEYPKNGGATFYNTENGKYYIPTGIDRNEPWDKATPEERANMIPVTPRNWDWNAIHLVYPIPANEMTANKQLEQNPGY